MASKRNLSLAPQNHTKGTDLDKKVPAEKSYDITQAQANLLVQAQNEHNALMARLEELAKQSQAKLLALIAGVLAGHGVTEGHAIRVEPGEPPKLIVAA